MTEGCAHCARREAELAEKHRQHRWNVEETVNGIIICKGDHPSGEGCQWTSYLGETETAALRDERDALKSALAAFSRQVEALEAELTAIDPHGNEATARHLRACADAVLTLKETLT